MNTLVLDIEEMDEPGCLIALYSTIDIFRVAYLINQELGLSLKRTENDVEFVHSDAVAFYPLYHYFDEKKLIDFYLVTNKAKIKSDETITPGVLFENDRGYDTFLVPERKNADYFLKIEGTEDVQDVLQEIKKINLISATFSVDIGKLQSYKNLIFD